jgi:integrase/recombinase XerC
LPGVFVGVLSAYVGALAAAPLAPQTRRTYASKVRQYLAWLAVAEIDAEPLATTDGRDWAMRDYRTHIQAVAKRSPATVNNALAAVDDFCRSATARRTAPESPVPSHDGEASDVASQSQRVLLDRNGRWARRAAAAG